MIGTSPGPGYGRGVTRRAALAVGTVVAALIPITPADAGEIDILTEDVTFIGEGGTTLQGTVITPALAQSVADLPAMVLVHGSGPAKREHLRPVAEQFARNGIVTLIYDKRTEGYSILRRDYSTLANDAVAAVQMLRQRAGLDQGRIGMWGLSEGGWVAPLAASRSTDVDFLVTVAANGGPPVEQQQWSYGVMLDYQGVQGSLVRSFSVTMTRHAEASGTFPEAYYDPVPVLQEIRQPVLALWGEHDLLTPPGESLTTFRETFEATGHDHYTLRIIPGGDHALHQTPDGGYTRADELVPGYVELVSTWIDELADGPPVASADPAPAQERTTTRLEPLAWYESGWLQLAAIVIFVVAFVGYPAVALVRRLRGHRLDRRLRPARWLATTGALVTFGWFVYFAFLVVTAAQRVGPVVLGRPVPWLLLQLLALAALASLVATIVAWRKQSVPGGIPAGERVRLGLLTAGGVVLLPWALYWGLLFP